MDYPRQHGLTFLVARTVLVTLAIATTAQVGDRLHRSHVERAMNDRKRRNFSHLASPISGNARGKDVITRGGMRSSHLEASYLHQDG